MAKSSNVLEIENLRVGFRLEEGDANAVNDVNLNIPRGEIVALVGESGSGKSVTSYAVLRLIQPPGRITGGRMMFYPKDGEALDIAALSEKDRRLYELRGNKISMIFQEPMTALSPVHTLGDQLSEALYLHGGGKRREVEARVVEMLDRVGIPAPERRLRQYPFELSGGMRQRVVIALAMLTRPDLLIADEPTTALDVTIQAQVLELMKTLQREQGGSILLVTHDLGVVAQTAHRVAVMYLGRIVEQGSVRDILKHPRHPYTQGLLASLPGLHAKGEKLPSIPGTVPGLMAVPPGCPFHPRCPFAASGLCDVGVPPPECEIAPGRMAACHRVEAPEVREGAAHVRHA